MYNPLAYLVVLCYHKTMNGYDFDDTIYRGNSMRRFSIFCMLHLPYLVLYLPVVFIALLLRAVRILPKNAYLLLLEGYIVFVPHVEKLVVKFWDKNMSRIKTWYLDQRQKNDIVVSATPIFVVGEACRRLGVECIATDMNARGRLNGKHCHGKRKVETFQKLHPDVNLDTYYSDSTSDKPMWCFAERGYLVKGEEITLVYENGVKIRR